MKRRRSETIASDREIEALSAEAIARHAEVGRIRIERARRVAPAIDVRHEWMRFSPQPMIGVLPDACTIPESGRIAFESIATRAPIMVNVGQLIRINADAMAIDGDASGINAEGVPRRPEAIATASETAARSPRRCFAGAMRYDDSREFAAYPITATKWHTLPAATKMCHTRCP